MHHYPTRNLRLMLPIALLALTALACNLLGIINEASPPAEAISPPQPTAAPPVQDQLPTPTATSDMPPTTNPGEAEAPPKPPGNILAAGQPAVPDCNAFDIQAFNDNIDGEFTFITQDQLNNCHFESNNGFRLLIGGGKPISSDEMQQLFDSSFGALPNSTWEVVDNFFLGLAFSSVSVTAQGVSASGHSLAIVAASQSGSDPETLKTTLEQLARVAAQQLNAQW